MTRSDINIDQIRVQLINRRTDILALRRSADRSWQRLQEPEIESEEMGAKYSLAQGLEQLDENSRRQIQQIDQALARITEGRYGRCEDCGERISAKRLRALPWTPRCRRCAEKGEEAARGSRPARSAPKPIDTGAAGELSDSEIVAAVNDALQRDGRVETEELQISSNQGVIQLEGVLPGENSRRVLHEIVETVLDFKEIEDRIAIDRTLWETRRRSREIPDSPEKEADETLMEGEKSETEVSTSKAEGKPFTPPDSLRPEKK